jgi:hypothetical protein
MRGWVAMPVREPDVKDVRVTRSRLAVELTDGRIISAPLDWYPRLAHGTPKEWRNWQVIGGGEGIHWPDLDEDISVEGLLNGGPSGERPRSLQRWLNGRTKKKRKQPRSRM